MNNSTNYQKICSKCGMRVNQDLPYCPGCGKKFGKEGDKKKNIIISILAVLLVTLIFIIVALVVRVSRTNNSETELNLTTAETETKKDKKVVPETPKPDVDPVEEEEEEEEAEEETEKVVPVKTADPEKKSEDTESVSGPIVYDPYDIITAVVLNEPVYVPDESPLYDTYYDDEFGFEIGYPAEFGEYRYDVGGVRGYYLSDDGSANFRICAAYNKGGITPEKMKNSFISTHGGSETYSRTTDEFFAISLDDYNDDEYHYAYYSLRNGKIIGFEFHFRGQDGIDVFSKYIDTLYASLKRY